MDARELTVGNQWEFAVRCHPGLKREVNEDAYLARPDLGLWAVADGMGGHARGDLASRMIIEAFDAIRPDAGCDRVAQAEAALKQAHERILALSREMRRTVGSTVVVLVAEGDTATLLWVGDSRLYRFRNGRLERLSRDHSMVQEMIDQGLVREEEAEQLPDANVITRAVGIEAPELQIDRLRFPLESGDLFLLCSDGLTREIDDSELAEVLAGIPSLEAAADHLLQRVLSRGAHDNVTLILLRYHRT